MILLISFIIPKYDYYGEDKQEEYYVDNIIHHEKDNLNNVKNHKYHYNNIIDAVHHLYNYDYKHIIHYYYHGYYTYYYYAYYSDYYLNFIYIMFILIYDYLINFYYQY